MSFTPYRWVGHRGWPAQYPENSLIGIQAAIEQGADAVEVDIQFTKDGEPVVLHDATLMRVSHIEGELAQLNWSEIQQVSVHEPERFGAKFRSEPIAHLTQMVALLLKYPDCHFFVEVKCDAFETVHRQKVLQKLIPLLSKIAHRLTLISYDLPFLRLVQSQLNWPVGWVIDQYNENVYRQLQSEAVDILICDIRKIPSGTVSLWSGHWQWFIYDVTSQEHLNQCLAWQVNWIETWDIKQAKQLSGNGE